MSNTKFPRDGLQAFAGFALFAHAKTPLFTAREPLWHAKTPLFTAR